MCEAVEYAATLTVSWSYAASDEKYDRDSLLGLAEVSDDEYPLDEDCFYLVSPHGSIGICQDDGHIDWLLLANSGNENLPFFLSTSPQIRFCPYCGFEVVPEGDYCGNCGKELSIEG